MEKKIILLTNDDGIESKGIKTLYKTLIRNGNWDIWIVAPDKERSAAGHAITVFDPISVKKEFIDGIFCGYAVDGTPADCVKLAIGAIFEKKPDLLISGINRGANLGKNIIYSGTVSAATEGTIYDVPSIAVSINNLKDTDYTYSAEFTKNITNLILDSVSIPERMLLNINIPDAPADKIKGVKITYQSDMAFKDVFIKREDPRGREYYWMNGELVEAEEDENNDYTALKNNYISITPIQHDMTDYRRLDYFKSFISKGINLE